MKFILTPNPNPPHNLIRMCPAYNDRIFNGWTEDAIIQEVIRRNIEVGLIPSDAPYWVVDETDLPGGSVSPENDYFFDAWEWSD